MRRFSLRAARSRSACIAKGKRHRAQAVESSEHGLTKADAARRVSLTLSGLNSLLTREFGSTKWPIQGHEPPAQS